MRFRSKLILLHGMLLVFGLLLFMYIDAAAAQDPRRPTDLGVVYGRSMDVVIDPETKCEYLLVHHNNQATMTPRYQLDGNQPIKGCKN